MKAWIIYNGFLQSDKFIDFAQMLQKAAVARGHHAILKRNDQVINQLQQDHTAFFQNEAVPDYILCTDKDIYLARQLELLGIPVFNSAAAIEISDDKIKTYQQLASKHIPIPKTVVAPKTFGIASSLDESYINSIIAMFGFPLIIKEAFGSFGEQVYLVTNKEELHTYIEKLAHVPYVFQEFIDTSYGKDIRLQVVGDKVVCAMIRTSENDFRANVTSGGQMNRYEPNDLQKSVAISASKAIGADFSGVDVLFGQNGEAIVCEVNSNAHIRNLLDCTEVNAADDILCYIEKRLQKEVVR